jgi:hypothetical protein
MKKEFNDTGSCNPDIHYMVDTGEKIDRIAKLIEKGKYFTINRPRQYGKSTCLESIEKRLSTSDYVVMFTTFESMSEVDFLNEKNFIREFLRQLNKIFKRNNYRQLVDFIGRHNDIETFGQLDDFITGMVELIGKPTVLQIDEVDKSSDNRLFLNFLGLLRSKYLSRHKYSTFHSVILASVYDIKTLKSKIRPNEERKYNSPWNIAADFRVDLTFTPKEIATMLADYSNHTKIKLDIPILSEKLYYYTSGHPFLVSKICKIIDEEILPGRQEKEWSVPDVDAAFEGLVRENYTTTNFDEMVKNLENNKGLYDLVFKIIMDGERKSFNIGNPVINLGAMFGILEDSQDGIIIQNRVYEQRIYNYMSSKIETSTAMEGYNFRDNFLNKDNTLDFEKILLKFQEFMKLQYSKDSKGFLEKDGRLVFLAFIKPIINQRGFDFKEVQISEEKRLDVVITYMNSKYIVELKKWYSEKYHKKGIVQLSAYLDRQDQKRGYLIIFDFRSRKKDWKHERIYSADRDKKIFAVWV